MLRHLRLLSSQSSRPSGTGQFDARALRCARAYLDWLLYRFVAGRRYGHAIQARVERQTRRVFEAATRETHTCIGRRRRQAQAARRLLQSDGGAVYTRIDAHALLDRLLTRRRHPCPLHVNLKLQTGPVLRTDVRQHHSRV